MNKENLNNYIQKFLKGKLSSEEELELLLWIKQDSANKNEFLKIQHSISSKILRKNSNTEYLKWQELKRKINDHKINSAKGITFKNVISYAAVLLAGIIISYLLIPNKSSSYSHFQTQNITAPYGARTSFNLPDSSIVWLNSGSTLSFSNDFRKGRTVKLKGEAFFEVVKSQKPFIVYTNYGEVEVKGTSFNVKAFADENLEATLVTGSILIRNENLNKEVTLEPGQQGRIDGNKVLIESVDTEIFTSWKDGEIIFRKEYLPQLAKRLERWYNVKISLDDDPRLEKIHYSGKIEMESFSEILELLKVTAPIDYSFNEKNRVISIKYNENH
jgi:ferric-dicitrate binding protein FerR (iron transport regulator)